jgi:hypothetical protein
MRLLHTFSLTLSLSHTHTHTPVCPLERAADQCNDSNALYESVWLRQQCRQHQNKVRRLPCKCSFVEETRVLK